MGTTTTRILLLAILGLTLLFSLTGYVILRGQERDRARVEFARAAGERFSLIEERCRSDLLSVKSLGAMCAHAADVTRPEFRSFVTRIRADYPTIRAWEWIPRVSSAMRAEREAAARRDGVSSFEFTETDASGAIVRARPRDEYYPVYYVEPLAGNEAAVGFDLGSDPIRRAAIEAARDSGQMAATARITLVQETEGQAGLLVFQPVYRDGSRPETVADRQANLVGFALGVVRIGVLVQDAIAPLAPSGVAVRVVDVSVSSSPTVLFAQGLPPSSRGARGRSDSAAFHDERIVDLAGRKWLLECEASRGFENAWRTSQPELALVIGLVIVASIAAALVGMLRRGKRLERIVQERTRELSAANESLAAEVAERRKTEAVLVQQERDTRTLLDALPGYVFFKDIVGKYLLANEPFRRAVGCHADSIEGKTDFDFMPANLAAKYRVDDEGVLQTGEPLLLDEEPFIDEGRHMVVSTRKVPLTNGDGRVIGLLGLSFDVTRRKLAEQALQEERDLFVGGPVIVFKWRPTDGWPVEYVSSNIESQWGYRVHELASADLLYTSLVHPDDLARIQREVGEHLRLGTACFEREYRLRRKDGEYRWVYDFTVVTRDPAGSVNSFRGYVVDNTDRRELEEVLRKSREQLQMVLAGSNDGLWDWNIVAGSVEYSARWAEMLGYRPDEVEPSVKFWEQNVHPDDKPAVTEALNRHLQGFTPSYESEHRMRTKSGAWMWILDRGKVVARDANGRPTRAAGTHTDITVRRQAQHDLTMLQLAVEQSVDGIALADLDGRIQFVNRSFVLMHGYGQEELAGRSMEALVAGTLGAEGFASEVAEARRTGAWAGEVTHARRDGTRFAAWVTNTLTKDRDGRPIGMIMTVRDITAPKQAEAAIRQSNAAVTESLRRERAAMMQLEAAMEQLRAATEQAKSADQAKSDFLTNMSHEIRSPLTAIIGYMDMLSRTVLKEKDRADCCERAKLSAQHLLGLINEVLDLSKIEAGQMRIHIRRCSLPKLIDEVCSLLRPQADAKSLSLRAVWDDGVPQAVESDPVHFKQILINLVGNAVKFTERGGITVRVGSRELPESGRTRLTVQVADTGIGIPAERMAELFSPFVQVHTREMRDYGGTGLGLTISRHLARMLGGDISMTSVPGEGSVFTLAMDVVDGSRMPSNDTEIEKESREESGSDAAAPSLDGVRVLVVDDGPDNQRIIRFLLEEARASVDVADNGKLGVEAVQTQEAAGKPYDLILMDMRMPVMDGYAATGRLREAGVRTPIAALTAYAMSGDESRCLSAGCDAYVSKPIEPGRFFSVIATLLKRVNGKTAEAAAGRNMPAERAGAPADAGAPSPARTERWRESRRARLVSSRISNPRFLPILKEYCDALPDAIEEILRARRACDWANLQTAVHRIAGTGGMYGFPVISERGRQCEKAIMERRSSDEIDVLVDELIVVLRSVSMDEAEPVAVVGGEGAGSS